MLKDVIAPRLQRFVSLSEVNDSFTYGVRSEDHWEFFRMKEANKYCFTLFSINIKAEKGD